MRRSSELILMELKLVLGLATVSADAAPASRAPDPKPRFPTAGLTDVVAVVKGGPNR